MGSNVEKGGKGTHNDILTTPLYSNGTADMDGKEVVGTVEGPKKPPACNTEYASVHGKAGK